MRKHGVKFTQEDFLEGAVEVWGDLYDYSKSKYEHALKKIIIICREHGEFWQTPAKHVNIRQGCRECAKKKWGASNTRRVIDNKYQDVTQPEDYKLIPLTQGKFAKVDNEDFDRLKGINWKFNKGYAESTKYGSMHRFILNAPRDKMVDHIDTINTLDNRRSNIRLATPQENTWNSKPSNSTKLKGVRVIKNSNKFSVVLIIDGKKVLSKTVYDKIEGGQLYDLHALKYQGDFAWLNFPENKEEYLKKLSVLDKI